MSRAARRAAQRKAQEAATKTAAVPPSTNISEAQLAANRANAQFSCGPTTEAGKLKSSHNALKTGLTGRTILLPTDDVAAYQKLVNAITQRFNPASDLELHLVQNIADTEWRLLRIPTLEAGIFALGRKELADQCADESNPQIRAAMLDALVAIKYEKELRNLALQEKRLRNYLKHDTAELRRLQAEAQEKAMQETKQVDVKSSAPPPNGFEFSTCENAPMPAVIIQPVGPVAVQCSADF